MFNYLRVIFLRGQSGRIRAGLNLALLFLIIEFYDELSYGVSRVVLPSLRADLALSYAEVGLLLGLPHVINAVMEPGLMLLGDTRLRKGLMLAGGAGIALSSFLIARAGSFPAVLLAFVLVLPASGAFVTLSQATLMDINSGREAQMMARWAVAGTLGNLAGPLLVAGGFALALGWRWAFLALGLAGIGLTLLLLPRPLPAHAEGRGSGLGELVRGLWKSARDLRLLRWIFLAQTSDLLMDVFTSYFPLYFTDVVGFTPTRASLLLGVYTLLGLASSLALIPILERFPGRKVVRLSAAACIFLYIAWLVAPWPALKVALVLSIALAGIGWYAVIDGEIYAAGNGRSGTVKAISSIGSLLGGTLIWLVGYLANAFGLQAAMWLLLLGPASLVIWVPQGDV